MATLIEGDDGLQAEEVGAWAKDKHGRLRRYLDISRATRKKFLTGPSRSAAFIDLFCGSGRALIKETGEWIDGSAVAAWRISRDGGAPFSRVYVSDIDAKRRAATVERLLLLGAPVHELKGSAIESSVEVAKILDPYGLHFAFLDPFSLGALDFKIIRSLASVKRLDMMVHVSVMDLQRNLRSNLGSESEAFDRFAPGWRDEIDLSRSQFEIRRQILDHWRKLVADLDKRPSNEMELIKGDRGQRLYWLLLIAEHKLAHKFWEAARNTKQTSLRL